MNKYVKLFISLLLAMCFLGPGFAQENLIAPKGILLGENWNSLKRELDFVFENQSEVDLGEKGVRTIQIWTEIINSQGKEFTWIVEYANGMKQEIYSQKIRYNRFRTYLTKTFRRKLWNQDEKKLVSVSGMCRVYLIDKNDADKLIVEKQFILK